jgi:hypothetical protein
MKKFKIFGIEAPIIDMGDSKQQVMIQFKEYLSNIKA